MKRFATLAATAALLTAAALPGVAQQQPSDTGTNANGPITIIKNYVAEGPGITVRVDGKSVEHLRDATYADITTSVHAGQNTLTVTWNAAVQQLHFKISYAATRNNFKDVAVVNASASQDASLRAAGSKTVSFTIPG